MDPISLLVENFSALASVDSPVFVVQLFMVSAGAILIFFVLFATRDILLRTHSFLYQIVCILIVAALPVLGFLLYLLIRPSTTCRERTLDETIAQILAKMTSHHPPKKPQQQDGQSKGGKKQQQA